MNDVIFPPQLTEYELCIASDLVDPLAMVVSWENIGGLEGTINEILETVILPFHDNSLVAQSSLVQPPKGKITAVNLKLRQYPAIHTNCMLQHCTTLQCDRNM